MYKVERSALVMHSAAEMLALVNDGGKYHEFLPWCSGSRVLSWQDGVAIASVDIAFKGIHKTFTTRNEMVESSRTNISLVNGPFSELSGFWEFTEISAEASKIRLELGFGFSNRLVGRVVGPVFRLIADSMVDSFCKRADQIYQEDQST